MSNYSFLERILQCAAVICWVSILPGFFISALLSIIAAILYPNIRILFLFYYVWIYTFDSSSPFTGGWTNRSFGDYFRNLSIWNKFKDYFNSKLIKEQELDPQKSYILGYHPHGVYCLSVQSNLFLNGSREKPFPGLQVRCSTLPVNFSIPFWREFILATGTVSVDKKSLVNVLKQPGTCLLIAIGGANEFHYMEENSMDLVIKKRKGFAKLALETGSDLVPIIGFGENELFSKIRNPIVEQIDKITYLLGRFAAPMFVGRSPTWIPKRSTLVTVVGTPIPVEKVENPTNEQILELHKNYLHSLKALYNKYKDTYHKSRKRELRFVE